VTSGLKRQALCSCCKSPSSINGVPTSSGPRPRVFSSSCHSAGLHPPVRVRTRTQPDLDCQHCDGVTPVAEGVCRGCGEELDDPFRSSLDDD
jgi:hypothetical protein